MELAEVRNRFLTFFENKGHHILQSEKLIPKNDLTTLFVGSGMQPLLKYLLGEAHKNGKKLANSQRCFRSNDIDEVGDYGHTTFFEMLGNWSLGEYFKEEQIKQCFDFLTNKEYGLSLDPNKLYVTVFGGDEKLGIERDNFSANMWSKLFESYGVSNKIAYIGSQENGYKRGMLEGERIFFYDAEKNWWSRFGLPESMPIGEPGGGDSEVFYDFGEEFTSLKYKHLKQHPNSDSGRFTEICNSVFMEYLKTKDGFVELKYKNVDFGAGLERLTAATNNNPDVFEIDIFKNLIKCIGDDYYNNPKPYRIISDHMRSSIFIINDGVEPANTLQGYVLRRLLRKSIYLINFAFNKKLSVTDIAKEIIKKYLDVLDKNKVDFILDVIDKEEKQFLKTLDIGMKYFYKFKEQGILSGKDAFILQSTYGFPLDLIIDLTNKEKIDFNIGDYNLELEKHREISKVGAKDKFKGGLLDDKNEMCIKYHTATHLLNRALKDILGNKVSQKGSNITEERLRFDFNYEEKLTLEQIKKIEELINSKIKDGIAVEKLEVTKAAALKMGAIGLFDDKYGEMVSVYKIGDYSIEFCGGPHVKNIKDLGTFSIQFEKSVSKGVRRIKAVLI